MNLKETFDWYVKAGYLKCQTQGDLTLYCYTTQCALKGNWNYHTRNARGHVLDNSGNWIARPFPKFWSVGEIVETYPQNLPTDTPEVAVKYDGSLIIIFQHEGTWIPVTRKRWDNIQTKFAKTWLEEHSSKLEPGYTYCFELIAPWNQVVIPYDKEDMIFLGRIDQYGLDCSYQETQNYATENGLTPIEFFVKPLSEIDVEDIPYDQEGYVARFANGYRVKLKSPFYVEQHTLRDKQSKCRYKIK